MKRKRLLTFILALAALALAGCGNPNVADTAGPAVVVIRVSGRAQQVEVTPSRGELTASGGVYTIALTDRSPLVVTVSSPGYRTVMLRFNAADMASGRAEREVVMDSPAGATLELNVRTGAKAEQLNVRVSGAEAAVSRRGNRFTVELPDRGKAYTVVLGGEGCAERVLSLSAAELTAGYCSKTVYLAGADEKVLELLGEPQNFWISATGRGYRSYEPQDMVGGRYLVVAADDLVELEISDAWGGNERCVVDVASLAQVYCTVYREPPQRERIFVDMSALEESFQGNRFCYEAQGIRTVFYPYWNNVGEPRYGAELPPDCIVYVYQYQSSESGDCYAQYRCRVERGKLLPEPELVTQRRVFTVRFIDLITGESVGGPVKTASEYPKLPAGYKGSNGSVFEEQLIDGEWVSNLQVFHEIDLRFRVEDESGSPYPGILPATDVEPLGGGQYLLRDFWFYENVGTISLRHKLTGSEAVSVEEFRLYTDALTLSPDGVYEYAYPLTCTNLVSIDRKAFRFLPEGAPAESDPAWMNLTVKLSADTPGRVVEAYRGDRYYAEFGSSLDITLTYYDSIWGIFKKYFVNGLTLDETLLGGDRIIRVKPDPQYGP